MPSNTGTTGLETVHNGREVEYRAFDTLPQALKDALREANCKFSAVSTLTLYRKIGTTATIKQLEKMSFKAYCNSFPDAAFALIGIGIEAPLRRKQP